MRLRLPVIASLLCITLLGACTTPDGVGLGLGGAAAGAAIGGARGGLPGAVIGGIVGGVVGGATGDAIDHANGYPYSYPAPAYAAPGFACENVYSRFAWRDGYGYWHSGWVRRCP